MKKFRFPLWAKTLLVLLLSVLTMSVLAVVYSANRLRYINREHYLSKSVELADTLGLYLNLDDIKEIKGEVDKIYKTIPENERVSNKKWDSPEWETYLAKFESILELPAYDRLMGQISEFHKLNDAKYMYVSYADFDNKHLIYLADDSPEDERCLPGSFDNFTPQDMSIFDDLESGFKPEITNSEEYGYLASVGRPIFDDNHDLVAFSLVDLSMDDIVAEENVITNKLVIVLLSVGVSATLIGYLLVLFFIIKPVQTLTKTANEFTKGDGTGLDKFSKIKINTKQSNMTRYIICILSVMIAFLMAFNLLPHKTVNAEMVNITDDNQVIEKGVGLYKISSNLYDALIDIYNSENPSNTISELKIGTFKIET